MWFVVYLNILMHQIDAVVYVIILHRIPPELATFLSLEKYKHSEIHSNTNTTQQFVQHG